MNLTDFNNWLKTVGGKGVVTGDGVVHVYQGSNQWWLIAARLVLSENVAMLIEIPIEEYDAKVWLESIEKLLKD